MIKKLVLIVSMLALTMVAYSQGGDSLYQSADVMPEFTGGEMEMYNFLAKNIEYPREAKEQGITGEVYAEFIVNKDGSISNIKIVKDIGGGCGAEVLKALKAMPNWKPATNNGKTVRVQYVMPVSFQEEDGGPSKAERKALRKMQRKLNRELKKQKK